MYRPSTICAMLSFLIYEEINFVKKAKILFPFLDCKEVFYDKDGSYFFSLLANEETNELYLIHRGTDGFNKWGRIKSWIRNFTLWTSGDGVSNGVQKQGDLVINTLKDVFYKYKTIYIGGHSQGSDVMQYVLVLLGENFTHFTKIHGEIFASFPAGNKLFQERYLKLEKDKKVTLNNYFIPGDPSTLKIFHTKNSSLLNGEDIGTMIQLPALIGYDLKIYNAVKHSCRLYCASLVIHYLDPVFISQNGATTGEEFHLIGQAYKMLIN